MAALAGRPAAGRLRRCRASSASLQPGVLICSICASHLGQVAAMAKKGIHPEWHNEAKVICNGEEVLTTSGTQGSYTGEQPPRANPLPFLCCVQLGRRCLAWCHTGVTVESSARRRCSHP